MERIVQDNVEQLRDYMPSRFPNQKNHPSPADSIHVYYFKAGALVNIASEMVTLDEAESDRLYHGILYPTSTPRISRYTLNVRVLDPRSPPGNDVISASVEQYNSMIREIEKSNGVPASEKKTSLVSEVLREISKKPEKKKKFFGII